MLAPMTCCVSEVSRSTEPQAQDIHPYRGRYPCRQPGTRMPSFRPTADTASIPPHHRRDSTPLQRLPRAWSPVQHTITNSSLPLAFEIPRGISNARADPTGAPGEPARWSDESSCQPNRDQPRQTDKQCRCHFPKTQAPNLEQYFDFPSISRTSNVSCNGWRLIV